jgi:MYXO-CTERM domain-containing protein
MLVWVGCVLALGACNGMSGCGAPGPLPAGGLPATQTIEGGAQIRLTPQGFAKLTAGLAARLDTALGGGFCLGRGQIGEVGTLRTGTLYCDTDGGDGCTPGCQVPVSVTNVSTRIADDHTLEIDLTASVHTTVHFIGTIVGIPFECSAPLSSDALQGTFDVTLDVDPATGESAPRLRYIEMFHVPLDFSSCSFVSSIADFSSSFTNAFIGAFEVEALTPAVEDVIADLVAPRGVAGTLGTGFEARIAPGGYLALGAGGLDVGVITGINSDANPTTRTPGLESEPAACAPPLPPPDLAPLVPSSRGTFLLPAAPAFSGGADPDADVAIGVSQSTLALAGHHLVTSGALCVDAGTDEVPQLTLAALAKLVPSLAAHLPGNEDAAARVRLRPQRTLDVAIGDSPALVAGMSQLEADLDVNLDGGWVPVVTMSLAVDTGLDLDFDAAGTIAPVIATIDAHDATVTIPDPTLVHETPEELAAVLPALLDLVVPHVPMPSVAMPEIARAPLEDLHTIHVASDFLSVSATLGTQVAAPISTGTARLGTVTTPTPAELRGGAVPRVALDVDAMDSLGRPLEWSYRLDGGTWRAWRPAAAPFAIEDRAFVFQGAYTIGVRSRVAGDYHTIGATIDLPVTIDSVDPPDGGDDDEEEDDGATSGCGCKTTGSSSGALLLAGVLAIVLRRRR